MGCLYPKPAYLSAEGKVTFVRHEKALGRSGFIHIRCGMCNGCKADHARDWAIRCYHESQMHHVSCFLTLTYDPEHLPACGSLDKRDLQLFWKALRNRLKVPIGTSPLASTGPKKVGLTTMPSYLDGNLQRDILLTFRKKVIFSTRTRYFRKRGKGEEGSCSQTSILLAPGMWRITPRTS